MAVDERFILIWNGMSFLSSFVGFQMAGGVVFGLGIGLLGGEGCSTVEDDDDHDVEGDDA